MTRRSFSLEPFPAAGPSPAFTIRGEIARGPHLLAVRYRLMGRLSDLVIPGPAAAPSRRDGLWKQTCLEFFVAARGSSTYWEFNLSPAGHWNVYRFAAYRQDMREETAFEHLPLVAARQKDSLELSLDLDPDGILPPGEPLDVGVSAVIEHADANTTFWALTHRGPRPDFHRRDSFIIGL